MKKLDARRIVGPEVTEVGKIWFGNKTVLPTASQESDARIGMMEKRLAAVEGDLAVIRGVLKNILERPLARDDFAPECLSEKDNGESIV